jgi:hypothetical protein
VAERAIRSVIVSEAQEIVSNALRKPPSISTRLGPYRKKLIEVALPLPEINDASAEESPYANRLSRSSPENLLEGGQIGWAAAKWVEKW